MARVWSCGFETGTLGHELGATSGGTQVIQSTQKRSGNFAMQFSQPTLGYRSKGGLGNLSTSYHRFCFYYSTHFGGGEAYIFDLASSAETDICILGITGTAATPAGRIKIFNCSTGSDVLLGIGTATLTLNAWNIVELKAVIGAGTGIFETKINGVIDQTFTGLTNNARGNVDSVFWGPFAGGYTANVYYDDLAVDNAAYCGDSKIIVRQPLTAGGTPTYNAWTKSTGTDAGALWDSTPFTTADFCSSSTSGAAQTAHLADFSATQTGHGTEVIGSGDTINACKAWFVAKSGTASSASNIRRRINSVDTDTAVTLTTADAYYETPIFTTTVANLDLVEIGVLHGANSNLHTVEDVGLLVEYSASAGITGTLAVTEAIDTAAITGALHITGTLAVTEVKDTAAITGALAITGTLAVIEAIDTAAITGALHITGTLGVTEVKDIAAFTGSVTEVLGAVYLDPAQLGSNIVLSNANLTATQTAAATGNARANAHHTSGKYYYEFTVNVTGNMQVGLCSAELPLTEYLGEDPAVSIGVDDVSGWLGAGGTTTAPALINGHTYGMAIDIGAGLAWCKDITAGGNWNADASANPVTGINGATFFEAAPPVWTPDELGASVIAWHDTSDSATVTIVSGRISVIADKSGNGWDLVQVTEAQRPFSTMDIGGRPSAGYDGTNWWLSTSNTFDLAQPCTIMTLWRIGSTTQPHAVVWDNFAASSERAIFFQRRGDLSSNAGLYAGALAAISASPLPLSMEFLSTTFLNGTSSSHSFNGATPTTYSLGATGLVDGFRWGGNPADGASFTGNIGFSIIIDRALTLDERQHLEGYAATRFDLNQIVLPPEHPYYDYIAPIPDPPIGAQDRGYTNKVIDLVPQVSDIAPVNNASGYALHDVVFYDTTTAANPGAFSNAADGLIIPYGHGVLTQKQNSTQGALPYLSGADGFYVEFEMSLSSDHTDNWPALWLLPREHDLAQSDHYAGDPAGYERWTEFDVCEGGGGFGPGQLCSVIDWQGTWGGTDYWRDYPTNTVPGAVTTNNYATQGTIDFTQLYRYGMSYSPDEGATGVCRWYRDDILIFTADAPIIARQQHFYLIVGSQSHTTTSYQMLLKRLRAYIPPSAVWSPADLGVDVIAWHDVSDPATVTVVNGAISAIADKSGNGWTLSQATAAQRPLMDPTTVGHEMSAQYDGSNRWLATTTALDVAQPCTVMMLFRNGSATQAHPIVWDNAAESGERAIFFSRRGDISSNAGVYAGALVPISAAPLSLSTAYLSTTFLNGASGSHSFNGATPTVYNFGTTGLVDGFRWSGDPAGGSSFTGNLCFSIIIDRALTTEERQNLEGYVAERFRLSQIVLPSDHPNYDDPLRPVEYLVSFGDSLTYGTGASFGNAWTTLVQYARGIDATNYGAGGQPITWIADSVEDNASTITNDDIVTINGGYNNGPWATAGVVESEMARAVAALPTGTRYIIMGMPTAERTDLYTGGSARAAFNTINTNLASTYGIGFFNTDATLKAASTHTGQDAIDDGNDIVPASQRSDAVHWNDAGHLTVATGMLAKITAGEWRVKT